MRFHQFPEVGYLSQTYTFEHEIQNFLGAFQCDLPSKVLCRLYGPDQINPKELIDLAQEDKDVAYLVRVLAYLHVAKRCGHLDGLSYEFKSLIDFGFQKLSNLVHPFERIPNAILEVPQRDKGAYPVKSLAYIVPNESLLTDVALLDGYVNWWLREVHRLFFTRLSDDLPNSFQAIHGRWTRSRVVQGYVYRGYTASWGYIFRESCDSVHEYLKVSVQRPDIEQTSDFDLVNALEDAWKDPEHALAATPDGQQILKKLHTKLGKIRAFIDRDIPELHPKPSRGKKNKTLTSSDDGRSTAPATSAMSTNGAEELPVCISNGPVLPRWKQAKRPALISEADEDEEVEACSETLVIRPKRRREFTTRAQVGQERMRVQNVADALVRSIHLSNLDFEQLNQYDLARLRDLLQMDGDDLPVSFFLSLLVVTGFPSELMGGLPIGKFRLGRERKPGVWLLDDSLIVVYKPFMPSLMAKSDEVSGDHHSILTLKFSLPQRFSSMLECLEVKTGNLSIGEANRWRSRVSPMASLQKKLLEVNRTWGTRVTPMSISNHLYRTFLLHCPENDKAQAITLFSRTPDLGYVPIHYQAHDLETLSHRLTEVHEKLEGTWRIVGAEFLPKYCSISGPLEVNDLVENRSSTTPKVEEGESAGSTGSNRRVEIQELSQLRDLIQADIPRRQTGAITESAIDLFNDMVSYTVLWLLFVFGLRPTKMLFLRNYFVDLHAMMMFISQKDDSRFTHSTVLPLTPDFVKQYENLERMYRDIAVRLEMQGLRVGALLWQQVNVPKRIPSRDKLLEVSPFKINQPKAALKEIDVPRLIHLHRDTKRNGKIKIKPLSIHDLFKENGFGTIPVNVGRHNKRSDARNAKPASEGFLTEEHTRLMLAHGAAGSHCLSPMSSLHPMASFEKLKDSFILSQKKYGFRPREVRLGGRL